MLACHAGGRGFESRPLRQLSKRAPETVPSFFGSSSIHGAHDESLAQVPAGRRLLAAGSRFSLRRTSPADRQSTCLNPTHQCVPRLPTPVRKTIYKTANAHVPATAALIHKRKNTNPNPTHTIQ